MDAITPTGSHIESVWKYVWVWGALLVLTALTFALSFIDLRQASIVVAMAIALAKATLVVIFFMHLLGEKGASRLALALAFTFTLILATLALVDLKTRFVPAVAGEDPSMPRLWKPQGYNHQPVPLTPPQSDLMRPAQTNQSP